MRRVLLLTGLLVCGCKREPSFNETYDARAEELGDKANSIEVELGKQLDASMSAGGLQANPDTPELLDNQTSTR